MPLKLHQSPRARVRSLPVSFLCHPPISFDDSDEVDSLDDSIDDCSVVSDESPLDRSLCHTADEPPSSSSSVMNPENLPGQLHFASSSRSSRPAEPPIDDNEWVQIFSEILRTAAEENSTIKSASQILYEYISATNIEPDWNGLALSGGRPLRSVQNAFREFANRGPDDRYSARPMKRPVPLDTTTPYGRSIAPKPQILAAPSVSHTYGPAQRSVMTPMGSPQVTARPAKKRGRPSKQEAEARRLRQAQQTAGATTVAAGTTPAEAAASVNRSKDPQYAGPSRTPMAASMPTMQSPTGPGQTPQRPASASATTPVAQMHSRSGTSSGSSGKRRRGRPPKQSRSNTPPPPPPPPSFALAREPVDSPQTRRHDKRNTPPVRTTGSPTAGPSRSEAASPQAAQQAGPPRRSAERAEEGRSTPRWASGLLNEE